MVNVNLDEIAKKYNFDPQDLKNNFNAYYKDAINVPTIDFNSQYIQDTRSLTEQFGDICVWTVWGAIDTLGSLGGLLFGENVYNTIEDYKQSLLSHHSDYTVSIEKQHDVESHVANNIFDYKQKNALSPFDVVAIKLNTYQQNIKNENLEKLIAGSFFHFLIFFLIILKIFKKNNNYKKIN